MKKLFALAVAGLGSVAAFAEGGLSTFTPSAVTSASNPNLEYVTGTGGILETIGNYIHTVADKAWPVILAVVGIGLLIWLGRAMIRAVRAYFSTSM